MDVTEIERRLQDVVAGGKSDEQQRRLAPLVVMARLDAELRDSHAKLQAKKPASFDHRKPLDRKRAVRITGRPFYNICPYTLQTLLDDKSNLLTNLRSYVEGFSPEVRDALRNLKVDSVIEHLRKRKKLVPAVEAMRTLSDELKGLTGHAMTQVFDDLAVRTIEANNEEAYEAITPRDVVRLMVGLVFAPHLDRLRQGPIGIDLHDPAFGSGGALFYAGAHLKKHNPQIRLTLHGNERSDTTHALGVSNILISNVLGVQDSIELSPESTLGPAGRGMGTGHYILCNPPYGRSWKEDKRAVEREAAQPNSRFAVGIPSSSDGQMLFLLQALAKLTSNGELGNRAIIVSNGSPLFTGDAGSGPSNIRGHLLDNDWLDALVALPQNLFFNTGITTYLWVLDKNKPDARKGRILLVDARGTSPGDADCFVLPERRGRGDKRFSFERDGIQRLLEVYETGEGPVHWATPDDFKYRRITVERPTWLRFRDDPDRWATLAGHSKWQELGSGENAAKRSKGKARQEALLALLERVLAEEGDPAAFLNRVAQEADAARYSVGDKSYKLGWTRGMRAAVLDSLLEATTEPVGEPLRDDDGELVPNPELRDYERVPWGTAVDDYMAAEVLPHVPHAWVSAERVGWEIPFTRLFYTYEPPRPLREIETDIRSLRGEIDALLDGLESDFEALR